jgi:hypothetical protein
VTVRYELSYDDLGQLFEAIRRRGFRLLGPVLRDGAICYGDVTSPGDLPAGWADEQDGGTYRLRRRTTTRSSDTTRARSR